MRMLIVPLVAAAWAGAGSPGKNTVEGLIADAKNAASSAVGSLGNSAGDLIDGLMRTLQGLF